MSNKGYARVGAGTIFHEADPSWRDDLPAQERIEQERLVQRLVAKMADADADADAVIDGGGNGARRLVPLETFNAASFEGRPIPPRNWIVENVIADRNLTDFAGAGGTGKSLGALQLGVAVAGGVKWFGYETVKGGVLYVSAEDERDEIHRRLANVAEREGLSLAALDNFHFVDLTREPSTELAKVDPNDRQSLTMTDLFARLLAVVAKLRPKLLIIDTRADVYGGNEIDRMQVRTFIRNLQRLCRDCDLAILQLSHPSRKGTDMGDGQSGSTGWLNSARGGLYLTRDGDDPDMRILQVTKANYGPAAAEIRLRWENGVFYRVDTLVGGRLPNRAETERHVEERFLQHLAGEELRGGYVNGNKTGQRYAPRVFANLDASSPNRIGEKPYEAAMWRLRSAGQLAIGKTDGPATRQYDKFIVVDPMAPLKSLAERQVGAA